LQRSHPARRSADVGLRYASAAMASIRWHVRLLGHFDLTAGELDLAALMSGHLLQCGDQPTPESTMPRSR
jgi:hypothetical protein